MKYSEIVKFNKEFDNKKNLKKYRIFFLSNIVINSIEEVLEYLFLKNNLSLEINFSNYDNIIQESINLEKYDCIIVFWEFRNLIDGFNYSVENISEDGFVKFKKKIIKDIDYLFNNLKNCPLVLFNKFHNTYLENISNNISKGQQFCNLINDYLIKYRQPNLTLIDLNKVFISVGIENCIDERFYYSHKSPYTFDFFIKYSDLAFQSIFTSLGKSKKAIIFDCDNTLWGGIIGEDGIENIQINRETYKGKIYYNVQNIILSFISRGILIGICSKNNDKDFLEVFEKKNDMPLKINHFSSIRVNWNRKDKNIIAIAKELNIGLNSIIFVDDSDFEIGLIEKILPEVKTFSVPKELHNYPKELTKLSKFFYNNDLTIEDKKRNKFYYEESLRSKNKETFSDLSQYLKSLNIKLNININKVSQLDRISQLVLKTNQFNLTTKRYTKGEINQILKAKNKFIFSINVSDRFGDLGLTGISIIEINNEKKVAEIDIFLLSCRIIGRQIEKEFLNQIIQYFKNKNVYKIIAIYIASSKNAITSSFYRDFGFTEVSSNHKKTIFEIDIKNYQSKKYNLFEVKFG